MIPFVFTLYTFFFFVNAKLLILYTCTINAITIGNIAIKKYEGYSKIIYKQDKYGRAIR